MIGSDCVGSFDEEFLKSTQQHQHEKRAGIFCLAIGKKISYNFKGEEGYDEAFEPYIVWGRNLLLHCRLCRAQRSVAKRRCVLLRSGMLRAEPDAEMTALQMPDRRWGFRVCPHNAKRTSFRHISPAAALKIF